MRKDRLTDSHPVKGYWPGAPDLAIEVISPGNTYSEVEAKAMEWLNAGCRLVLTVNPRNRTVTAYRSLHDIQLLTQEDMLDLEDIVSVWSMNIKSLFG